MAQLDYGTHGCKGLSYSRIKALYTCPRLFQLEHANGYAKNINTVTFSFGHAVAAGVQEYFLSGDRNKAVAQCTRNYSMPWSDLGTIKEQRGKKSLAHAIAAVLEYIRAIESKLPNSLSELQEYEVLYVTDMTGKVVPAIELQFRILLNNDFVYEGHIDLVIRHKVTGEVAVLELKTSAFKDPHDALYGNSDQALSYAIVLDTILKNLHQTSYKVIYGIYSSPTGDWILKEFPKEAKRRFDWINNLIRTCEIIEYYEVGAADGIPYPTNGNSCYEFFKPCRYFKTCTMDDSSLELLYKQSTEESAFEKADRVNFIYTLDDIINTQIEAAEAKYNCTITTNQVDTVE